MKLCNFLVVSCLIGTAPALAATPSEIASAIRATAPYGQGGYTFLFMTAYDAQLWTDASQWSMQSPFALTLRYHMGFSTEDFVSRAKTEMKHVDPSLSDARLEAYDTAMQKVFPPVKSGDEITALYEPGKPVRIFKDGTETGTVQDAGFAEPFFGIWLSPSTSDPGLRKSLLHL